MERELTPTEIEIKKKEILDRIKQEELKDRERLKLKNRYPDVKITSIRRIKKLLKKNSVHPYTVSMASSYLKMVGLYHSAARRIKRKASFYKDISLDDVERPQRISYHDIMMAHIDVITH